MKEKLTNPNAYGLVFDGAPESGRILMQERWKPQSDPYNSDKFEMPGGKLRAFESVPDCVAREVREETGIEIDRFLDASSVHDFGAQGRVLTIRPSVVSQYLDGPYSALLIVVACCGRGTPLAEGDGSRNARWWSLEDVGRLAADRPEAITPLTLAAIRAVLELRP